MEDAEGLVDATTTGVLIATVVTVLRTTPGRSAREENTMPIRVLRASGGQGDGDSTVHRGAPADAALAEREE